MICVGNAESPNCSQHANALARHAGSDICLQQAWFLRTSSLALLLGVSERPYVLANKSIDLIYINEYRPLFRCRQNSMFFSC